MFSLGRTIIEAQGNSIWPVVLFDLAMISLPQTTSASLIETRCFILGKNTFLTFAIKGLLFRPMMESLTDICCCLPSSSVIINP